MNVEKELDITQSIPLISSRLLIDRFVPEDWIDYYEIENSPEQHRYNREIFCPRTKEQIEKFIKEKSESSYSDRKLPMLFAIRKKDTEKIIGFIGFKNGVLKKEGTLEVFYSINKNYWSRGFATEALKRIIEFGFNDIGLHRIYSGCDIDNIASKKVMENAGMSFESKWRKDRVRNGDWTDGLGFAILEEDIER